MTHNHSLPGLETGSLPRLHNMVQYDNPPSRALSAQHLPPHARACTIRFGAMSRSTVSALHAAYFSSGGLTALGFFTSQAVHSLAFYM